MGTDSGSGASGGDGADAGGSTMCGSAAAIGCGGGAGAGASAGGAAGLMVLTSRGGPSTGTAGFGGSAFLAGVVFLAPFAGVACSTNMSPPGSEIPRCRATRSTKERATTSSIVLDALFSSMP